MAIVYRHIRLDKNEPFYIGIGEDPQRPYDRCKSSRNNHWMNIIKKTEYRVDILFDDLTWEEACEKEKEFIKLYGRKDLGTGTLVNLSDGGEGTPGRIVSQKVKNFMSKIKEKPPKPHFHRVRYNKPWRVYFKRNGINIDLGHFETEALAFDAIKEWEKTGKKPEKKPFNHTEEHKKYMSKIMEKTPRPRFHKAKPNRPWRVSFRRSGKPIFLGTFHTEQEAQEAINLWIKNNNYNGTDRSSFSE